MMRIVDPRNSSHCSRKISQVFFAGLILMCGLLISLSVQAETPASWKATYYNSTDLTGLPALTRNDAHINFDWGASSPGPGVNADFFSAEWTNTQYFAGGNYTFYAKADDGVRVWVDDQLLVDQWHDHLPKTYSATRYLGPGYHRVRVTYFERTGRAAVRVWWARSGQGTGGWRGEYYGNPSLSGAPCVRFDSAINFDWGLGSPMPGVIPADNFSVRWTRNVYLKAGNYIFYATVDDGVRVSVNGVPVIEAWYPQSRTTHTGSIYLPVGTHQIRVEYFEETSDAVAIVTWAGSGSPPPPEPIAIMVDDQDKGFVRGGQPAGWNSRLTDDDDHLYWTWNSKSTPSNWAKWLPHITVPGRYQVYAYIPADFADTTQANYVVSLNGTQYSRPVDQSLHADQWASLGTFAFKGGADEYVYLSNQTDEDHATRQMAFDAIQFIKEGAQVPPPPSAPGCRIVPKLGFGRIWRGYDHVNRRLGCPLEMEKTVWMARQPFTGGTMLWRHDINGIYILFKDGRWQHFSNTWTTAEPEWDTSIVPPSGLYQPKRGFGTVWRGNARVRDLLGWAIAEEHGFFGSVQTYERGVMVWSPTGGVYVLYNDGRWEQFR